MGATLASTRCIPTPHVVMSGCKRTPDVAALLDVLRTHVGVGDLTCILSDRADVRVFDVDWGVRLGPPCFVGRARTVTTTGGVAPIRAMLPALRPSDVLVVRSSHPSTAVFGDRLADAATARGVAGVVVDGRVRDVVALEAGTLPVVALGVRPQRHDAVGTGTQDAVMAIGSTYIAPNDIVVSDRNGVVAVPASSYEHVLNHLDVWVEAERNADAAAPYLRDG